MRRRHGGARRLRLATGVSALAAMLAPPAAMLTTMPAAAQFVCESTAGGGAGANAAGSAYNTACGIFADAEGTRSGNTAVGSYTRAYGNPDPAATDPATASGSYNTAIGHSADASGDGSENTGNGAFSSSYGDGSSNTATGGNAWAYGDNSNNTATGHGAKAYGDNSSNVASGNLASASGDNSANIAIGTHADADGDGQARIAIGAGAVASGTGSVALGSGQISPTTGNVSVPGATASGQWSTSIGSQSSASADYSTALGYQSSASSDYSTAIGGGSEAAGIQSTAVGAFSSATGAAGVALGLSSNATGDFSIALGIGSSAGHSRSIAIGGGYTDPDTGFFVPGVATTRENQIAIGVDDQTYTLAGVAKQQSKDAQTGPTYFVTSDEDGNLATTTFDVATLQALPSRVDAVEAKNIEQDGRLNDHQTRIEAHSFELYDTNGSVMTNTRNIAALDSRVTGLEAGFAELGQEMAVNRREARGGIALALAAASLRYDDRPEKLSIAGGVGHFKGLTGLSFGVGYAASNSFRLNAAVSGVPQNGDIGFSAGMSWTLN